MRKFYTKEERIAFYTKRMLHAMNRLQELVSRPDEDRRDENYQDWDSDLQRELDYKRNGRRPARAR